MASTRLWNSPANPGIATINQLLLRLRARGAAPVWWAKREGRWQALGGEQIYRQVRAIAAGLRGLGLRPGDRVGLLAESRPEWLLADLGCFAAGVADVPIYPTLTGAQAAELLRDSGARGVFVADGDQQRKVEAEWRYLPQLEWICSFAAGPETGPRYPQWQAMLASAPAPDAEFEAELAATPPDRLATLIYTSGTTGRAKGVMLTHGNLAANLNAVCPRLDLRPERRLSVLPLAHITERMLGYADLALELTTYFAESIEKIPENLLEVRPHCLAAVPRVYEKMAAKVKAEAAAKGPLAERVFAWSLGVGRRLGPYLLGGWPGDRRAAAPSLALRLQRAVADRLVYRHLRERTGGELITCIAGGAPLGQELGEFLLALGLVVDEGYGMTETSPVIAVNVPGARKIGSVGKPLPNIEVRFAADGELMVRGPSVFSGYYDMPAANAAAFDQDPGGPWFHTGDIGHLDADGFLFITDRKKDLLKTAGGKFIAPQPIEAKLKASPYIAEAVLVGDRRPYVVALLVPNFARLESEARQLGLEPGRDWATRAELCRLPVLYNRIRAVVEQVNAGLARFETIKRFALLADEFTIAGGEITPTVKVRRKSVEAKYATEIAALYARPRELDAEATPGGEGAART